MWLFGIDLPYIPGWSSFVVLGGGGRSLSCLWYLTIRALEAIGDWYHISYRLQGLLVSKYGYNQVLGQHWIFSSIFQLGERLYTTTERGDDIIRLDRQLTKGLWRC